MSQAEPLRIGIVGLGFGGTVHLPAFLSLPGVQVVGVADSGSGRARRVAAGVGRDVRAWDSWKEAVEGDDVDAISVATPPYVQAEIVRAALGAGKHVLCEKPFGMSGKEAALMWEQAQVARLVGAVDFEFRMEPGICALKQLVESREVGGVRRIGVKWLTSGGADPSVRWSWPHDAELGGGVLNGFVSHVFDYVEWICERRIHRVSAQCETIVRDRTDAEGRTRKVTAEDHCNLACDLAGGVVARMMVSNCASSDLGHRIEIDGERGRLIYVHEPPFTPDKARLQIEINSRGSRTVPLEPLLPAVGYLDTRIPPFRALAERFVQAASGLTVRDLPDFACGMRVQQVLDAARESLRLGKAIPIVEETKAACQ
ncbi:MAG: Gfo/Idh/MocA family protein [bacterium]